MPLISLVVAAAANGVIGRDNRMPWHLPEDLAHFKRLTLGHPVVMGRKTYESILAALGKPLPGRTNIVLTRQAGFAAPGCIVAASLDAALAAVREAVEIFVIGGAEIYRLALDRADRVYLSRIDADFEGDATFPPLDPAVWRETERETHPPAGGRAFGFAFLRYDRRR
ncbi:MAG TPA: dihydrofolate reductase [Burkholderiales bacterium]|nr:dihydrofolate reductase [Burkholderiales bacterium]